MTGPIVLTIANNLEGVPGVTSAYLFGSMANGRAHRESDVDVGLLLDRKLYRTPYYCRACGHFSKYMAPLSLKSTKCEKCKRWGAVRTEFEYQRQRRLQQYRGASVSYRSGGSC